MWPERSESVVTVPFEVIALSRFPAEILGSQRGGSRAGGGRVSGCHRRLPIQMPDKIASRGRRNEDVRVFARLEHPRLSRIAGSSGGFVQLNPRNGFDSPGRVS